MWRMLGALVTSLALASAVACGDDSPESTASTAAGGNGGSSNSDAAGGSGGSSNTDAAPDREVDCSAVGCSPPPLCSEGCQAVCGCCACGEGQAMGDYVCRGGCYAPRQDAGAAWNAFAVRTGYGPCPANQVCSSSWRVEADGSVQAKKEGVDSSARMSQADLAELDGILKDSAFRRDMTDGFDCPQVTDVFTTLTLYAPEPLEQSVSGCVVNRPQTIVSRVVELVTKY